MTAKIAHDPDQIRRAVDGASLSALVMVLFQISGDKKWLSDRFRPRRIHGISADRSAGLGDIEQAEVKQAALHHLPAFLAGAPLAVPVPDPDTFVTMLEFYFGEGVSREYAEYFIQQMGWSKGPSRPSRARRDVRVGIVGAGPSGLLAAKKLREMSIPFTIFERQAEVGGTWAANKYPGVGVDTPAILYSFPDFPGRWTSHYPKQAEIRQYFESFAEAHDLMKDVRLHTTVDEVVYDAQRQDWLLRSRDEAGAFDSERFDFIISCVGLFTEPKVPDIPGLDTFAGIAIHSGAWPDDAVIDGKRVAVVGTGASAMQIVPAIVDQVAQLTVFQRTAQWVAPAEDYGDDLPSEELWLRTNVPLYAKWLRARYLYMFNDRLYPTLRKDPNWSKPSLSVNERNQHHREYLERYIMERLEGYPELQAMAIPDYPPYGKRMLLDSGWFSALKQPQVELVPAGVQRVTEHSVVTTDEREVEVDVIIMSTGYECQRFIASMTVRGRDGMDLREAWNDDDPQAYLGMCTSGFPNFFFMYGPQTNASGGNFLTTAEMQSAYILNVIRVLQEGEIGSIEPKAEVAASYNRAMDELHDGMVWTHPGVKSYFQNRAGRVVVNNPWSALRYWQMLQGFTLEDFVCEPRHALEGAGAPATL
jgi:4-hydroxyacetophenone monooxygenase